MNWSHFLFTMIRLIIAEMRRRVVGLLPVTRNNLLKTERKLMAKINDAFLAVEAVSAQLETATGVIVQTINDLRNANANRDLTEVEAATLARLTAAGSGVANIVPPVVPVVTAPVAVVDNS